LALSLCGCASANKLPVLPRDPDAGLREDPAIRASARGAAHDDARVAFMKDEAAIITRQRRIDAGRDCARRVRKSYDEEK